MFERKSIEETLRELSADENRGLSADEAKRRLSEYGENIFSETKPKTIVQMFLEQLNDPLIFILFVAAAISMLLHEFSDTLIIVAVILMNSVVGVIQEGKAQKALDALKKLTSPMAVVKRDGVYMELPASLLVPGDIVSLEAGQQVPADLRLIRTASLKVEEAALTGESVPSEKDAQFLADKKLPVGDCHNLAFMSTNVIYGRAGGVVTATGMSTEIGRIAGMLDGEHTELTPLQKRLAGLGKMLSIVAVLLCVALFAIAIFQKRDIGDMLITAISLAVAAVPEGLPAVVTIVLALSVSRMVKVNTIVRKLPSVETLGSVNIVCSDKTGTLTQNKMTVTRCYCNRRLFTASVLDEGKHRQFLEGFLLCNDARITEGSRIGDPTELALLDMGQKAGINKDALDARVKRTREIPFDSKRKMMTTYHTINGQKLAYTKGSCDVLLNRCTKILINGQILPMTQGHKREITKAMEDMASEALRVLALAMQKDTSQAPEKNLIFIGMTGMMDPARPEVSGAIELFKDARVKTVMITGDHVDTAFAIARQLKIASRKEECMSGEELTALSDTELMKRIPKLSVFARVSPEHKVRLVKAFKARGNIVAMTGDGVNDAPSLKAADIGIAMGKNGTDVAKGAADIILTDDNFATIERAIEEGRGIYENIRKSVLFLLSSNFGEIITMFFAILLGMASPLKASHILWINLITDSLPALALGVDKNDNKLLMSKPPRPAGEGMFARGGLFLTLFYGTLIAFISLAAFLTIPWQYLNSQGMQITLDNLKAVLANPGVLARCQTYAFTVLGVSQLFHAIGMRNVEESLFKFSHISNKVMVAAVFIGLGLQLMVTEIPYFVNIFGTALLSLHEWLRLIALAALPLLAHELLLFQPLKWFKKENKQDPKKLLMES